MFLDPMFEFADYWTWYHERWVLLCGMIGEGSATLGEVIELGKTIEIDFEMELVPRERGKC